MAFSQAVSGLNAAATNPTSLATTSPTPRPMVLNPVLRLLQICLQALKWAGREGGGYHPDFTDGTTTNTGRGLDVAISQNGFFRMVDANGSVFYSRNGQFKLDENRNR